MLNTYTGVPNLITAKAAGKLLGILFPKLMTMAFAVTEEIGKGESDTVKFRRYLRGGSSTITAATEGVTPAGSPMNKTDYSVQLVEYIVWYSTTDKLEMFSQDPIQQKYASYIAKDFEQLIESINIDLVTNGTQVIYGGGVAGRTSVATSISRNDLRKAFRVLQRKDVPTISEMVMPSTKIGTVGLIDSYVGMGHVDMRADFEAMAGFKSYAEYGNPGEANQKMGEIGQAEGIRIYLNSMPNWKVEAAGAPTTTLLSGGAPVSSATACDIYRFAVVGEGACGCASLKPAGGTRAQIIITPVDTPDKSDPARQRGSVAGKLFYGALLLDEQRVVRIEVGASSLN